MLNLPPNFRLLDPTGITEGVAVAGLASAVVGTAVSAYSSYQQQSAANAAAKYNQEVANDQAQQAQQLGTIEAEQHTEQVNQLMGQQRAAYAAAGVDPNTGSPVTVTSQTAGYGALDSMAIKENAATQAWGYTNQATLDSMKQVNPYGAAATSLLSSSSTIGSGISGLVTSGVISNKTSTTAGVN